MSTDPRANRVSGIFISRVSTGFDPMRDAAVGRAGRVVRDDIGRRERADDLGVRSCHRRDGRSVALAVGAPAPDPISGAFRRSARERWLDAREKLADNVSRRNAFRRTPLRARGSLPRLDRAF